MFDFSGNYRKALADRDALADRVTGVSGYASARDAGIQNIKNLMASRVNNAIQPAYGKTGIASFQDAIAQVNPELYDNYNAVNAANKQALDSANKRVGEAKEIEKTKQDAWSKSIQGAADAAKAGLKTYTLAANDKQPMEQEEQ